MTIFDLIALAVVGLSALAGFNRGAVVELLGLFAVALSAIATIAFLPATAPIARHFMHSGWLSAVVAAIITFAVFFLFLRLVAATVTASLNRAAVFGGLNRLGGLIFGGLRGVVLLALAALVFNHVTPQDRKPQWIADSLTYPMVSKAGDTLQVFLPKKFDPAAGFGEQLTNSINVESAKPDDAPGQALEVAAPSETAPISSPSPPPYNGPPSERAKPSNHGYTKHARDSVDALVERSK